MCAGADIQWAGALRGEGAAVVAAAAATAASVYGSKWPAACLFAEIAGSSPPLLPQWATSVSGKLLNCCCCPCCLA